MGLRRIGIVSGEEHDRQILIDERVRPVLHLAGRVALGVDVGEFLELERAFQGDWEVDAAGQEQKVVLAEQALRDILNVLRSLKKLFPFSAATP